MKIGLIFLLVLLVNSCGVIPGGGRFYSDSENVANYSIYGASSAKVRGDFGKPDKIEKTQSGETWTYSNREGGKTYRFRFDPDGKFLSVGFEEKEE